MGVSVNLITPPDRDGLTSNVHLMGADVTASSFSQSDDLQPAALRLQLFCIAVGRCLIGYSEAGQFSFIPVVFSRRKRFQIPTENRSGRTGTFLDLIIPPRPKFILFCFVRNTVWFENILSGILPVMLVFFRIFSISEPHFQTAKTQIQFFKSQNFTFFSFLSKNIFHKMII